MDNSQINQNFQYQLSIPELEKLLLETIEQGNDLGSLAVWNIACSLSIQYNQDALTQMKQGNIEKAEKLFIQSKKYTEPDTQNSQWHTQIEWYYQRINIFINLVVLYRKQKKIQKCYDLLQQIIDENESSEQYQKICSNLSSNIETLYFQLAESALELKDYYKSIQNAQKAINIIKFLEKDYNNNNTYYQNNNKITHKKILIKIHSYFLIGKSYSKLPEKEQQALEFFEEAYNLAKTYLKYDKKKLQKYEEKYQEYKQKFDLQQNINTELQQIDELKQHMFGLDITEQEEQESSYQQEEEDNNNNKNNIQQNKNNKQGSLHQQAKSAIQELQDALYQNQQHDNSKILRKKQLLQSKKQSSISSIKNQNLSSQYNNNNRNDSTKYSSMINLMNSKISSGKEKDDVRKMRSYYENLYSNNNLSSSTTQQQNNNINNNNLLLSENNNNYIHTPQQTQSQFSFNFRFSQPQSIHHSQEIIFPDTTTNNAKNQKHYSTKISPTKNPHKANKKTHKKYQSQDIPQQQHQYSQQNIQQQQQQFQQQQPSTTTRSHQNNTQTLDFTTASQFSRNPDQFKNQRIKSLRILESRQPSSSNNNNNQNNVSHNNFVDYLQDIHQNYEIQPPPTHTHAKTEKAKPTTSFFKKQKGQSFGNEEFLSKSTKNKNKVDIRALKNNFLSKQQSSSDKLNKTHNEFRQRQQQQYQTQNNNQKNTVPYFFQQQKHPQQQLLQTEQQQQQDNNNKNFYKLRRPLSSAGNRQQIQIDSNFFSNNNTTSNNNNKLNVKKLPRGNQTMRNNSSNNNNQNNKQFYFNIPQTFPNKKENNNINNINQQQNNIQNILDNSLENNLLLQNLSTQQHQQQQQNNNINNSYNIKKSRQRPMSSQVYKLPEKPNITGKEIDKILLQNNNNTEQTEQQQNNNNTTLLKKPKHNFLQPDLIILQRPNTAKKLKQSSQQNQQQQQQQIFTSNNQNQNNLIQQQQLQQAQSAVITNKFKQKYKCMDSSKNSKGVVSSSQMISSMNHSQQQQQQQRILQKEDQQQYQQQNTQVNNNEVKISSLSSQFKDLEEKNKQQQQQSNQQQQFLEKSEGKIPQQQQMQKSGQQMKESVQSKKSQKSNDSKIKRMLSKQQTNNKKLAHQQSIDPTKNNNNMNVSEDFLNTLIGHSYHQQNKDLIKNDTYNNNNTNNNLPKNSDNNLEISQNQQQQQQLQQQQTQQMDNLNTITSKPMIQYSGSTVFENRSLKKQSSIQIANDGSDRINTSKRDISQQQLQNIDTQQSQQLQQQQQQEDNNNRILNNNSSILQMDPQRLKDFKQLQEMKAAYFIACHYRKKHNKPILKISDLSNFESLIKKFNAENIKQSQLENNNNNRISSQNSPKNNQNSLSDEDEYDEGEAENEQDNEDQEDENDANNDDEEDEDEEEDQEDDDGEEEEDQENQELQKQQPNSSKPILDRGSNEKKAGGVVDQKLDKSNRKSTKMIQLKMRTAVNVLSQLKITKQQQDLPTLMFFKPLNNSILNYWKINFSNEIKTKNQTSSITLHVTTDTFQGILQLQYPQTKSLDLSNKSRKPKWLQLDEALEAFFKFKAIEHTYTEFKHRKSNTNTYITTYTKSPAINNASSSSQNNLIQQQQQQQQQQTEENVHNFTQLLYKQKEKNNNSKLSLSKVKPNNKDSDQQEKDGLFEILKKITFLIDLYALFKPKTVGKSLQLCFDSNPFSTQHKPRNQDSNFQLMNQYKKERKQFIRKMAIEQNCYDFDMIELLQEYDIPRLKKQVQIKSIAQAQKFNQQYFQSIIHNQNLQQQSSSPHYNNNSNSLSKSNKISKALTQEINSKSLSQQQKLFSSMQNIHHDSQLLLKERQTSQPHIQENNNNNEENNFLNVLNPQQQQQQLLQEKNLPSLLNLEYNLTHSQHQEQLLQHSSQLHHQQQQNYKQDFKKMNNSMQPNYQRPNNKKFQFKAVDVPSGTENSENYQQLQIQQQYPDKDFISTQNILQSRNMLSQIDLQQQQQQQETPTSNTKKQHNHKSKTEKRSVKIDPLQLVQTKSDIYQQQQQPKHSLTNHPNFQHDLLIDQQQQPDSHQQSIQQHLTQQDLILPNTKNNNLKNLKSPIAPNSAFIIPSHHLNENQQQQQQQAISQFSIQKKAQEYLKQQENNPNFKNKDYLANMAQFESQDTLPDQENNNNNNNDNYNIIDKKYEEEEEEQLLQNGQLKEQEQESDQENQEEEQKQEQQQLQQRQENSKVKFNPQKPVFAAKTQFYRKKDTIPHFSCHNIEALETLNNNNQNNNNINNNIQSKIKQIDNNQLIHSDYHHQQQQISRSNSLTLNFNENQQQQLQEKLLQLQLQQQQSKNPSQNHHITNTGLKSPTSLHHSQTSPQNNLTSNLINNNQNNQKLNTSDLNDSQNILVQKLLDKINKDNTKHEIKETDSAGTHQHDYSIVESQKSYNISHSIVLQNPSSNPNNIPDSPSQNYSLVQKSHFNNNNNNNNSQIYQSQNLNNNVKLSSFNQNNYNNNNYHNDSNQLMCLSKPKIKQKTYYYEYLDFFPKTDQIPTLHLIPHNYINTFFYKQILLTSILKMRKEIYFVDVKMYLKNQENTTDPEEEEDDDNTDEFLKNNTRQKMQDNIEIEVKVSQRTKGWFGSFKLSFYEFLDQFFPDNDISNFRHNGIICLNQFQFANFLNNNGFSQKEKQILEQKLRLKLAVQRTELTYFKNKIINKDKCIDQEKLEFYSAPVIFPINTLQSYASQTDPQRNVNKDLQFLTKVLSSESNPDYYKILFNIKKSFNKASKQDLIKVVNPLTNYEEEIFQNELSESQYFIDMQKDLEKISYPTIIKLKIFFRLKLLQIRTQKQLNQLKTDYKQQITSEQIEYANDHFSRVNDRTIISNNNNNYENNNSIPLLNYYNSILYLDRPRYMFRTVFNRKLNLHQKIKIKFLQQSSSNQISPSSQNHFNNFSENNNQLQQQQTYIEMSIYTPQYRSVEKCKITDPTAIEKIILIMQHQQEILDLDYLQNTLFACQMQSIDTITGKKTLIQNKLIESHSHPNYPKWMQKFNKNDLLMYDLLKHQNLLYQLQQKQKNNTNLKKNNPYYQSPSQFTFKQKFTLVCHDIFHRLGHSDFMKTYFQRQIITQQCKIQNLGYVQVQTSVFRTNRLYSSLDMVFIKFEILKKCQKSNSLKFIMELEDIKSIIQYNFNYQNCLQKEIIYQITHKLSQKLQLYKKLTYQALKIPMKFVSKNTNHHKYDLVNSYDPTSLSTSNSTTSNILSKTSFLTPVLRAIQIVSKGILRIQQQYIIYTVKKFTQLDYFQLWIYLPQSQKKWVCQLYPSDLLQFSPQFMELIFPHYIFHDQDSFNYLLQQPIQQPIINTQNQQQSTKNNFSNPTSSNSLPLNKKQQQNQSFLDYSKTFNKIRQDKYHEYQIIYEEHQNQLLINHNLNQMKQMNQSPDHSSSMQNSPHSSSSSSSSSQQEEDEDDDDQDQNSSSYNSSSQPSMSPQQQQNFLQIQQQNKQQPNLNQSKISEQHEYSSSEEEEQQNQQQQQNIQQSQRSISLKIPSSKQTLDSQPNIVVSKTSLNNSHLSQQQQNQRQSQSQLSKNNSQRTIKTSSQNNITTSSQILQQQQKNTTKHSKSKKSFKNNNSMKSSLQNQFPSSQQLQQQQQQQQFQQEEQEHQQEEEEEIQNNFSDFSQQQQAGDYSQNPKFFQSLFLYQNNQQDPKKNFFQMKLWELVISNIEIIKNKNQKFILSLDNFSGQLKESIYSNIINLQGLDNIHLEIFIDNSEFPLENFFSKFYSKRIIDKSTFYDHVYLKVDFFQQCKTTTDKVKLRHLFYTHYQENSQHLQNHKMKNQDSINMRNYEFNLADLQQIGKSCAIKIKEFYKKKFDLVSAEFQYNISKPLQDLEPKRDQDLLNDDPNYSSKSPSPRHNNNNNNLVIIEYDKLKDQNLIPKELVNEQQLQQQQSLPMQRQKSKQLSYIKKRQGIFQIENNEKMQSYSNLDLNIGLGLSLKEAQLMAIDETCKAEVKPNKTINMERLLRQQKPIAHHNNNNHQVIDQQQTQKNFYTLNSNQNNNTQNRFQKQAQISQEMLEIQQEQNRQYNESISNKEYLLIYRGVFTISPRQMIAIFYKKDKHAFYAYIWNVQNSRKIKQTIPLHSVIHSIPCMQQMIQMNHFQQLGKRIFLAFKNNLLISTYYKLNE